METFQVIFLSIVQGVTEFLPISSSAHLILPSLLFGWPDQGLVFDVAVHFGTLLAVMIYFRQKIMAMTQGMWWQCLGKGVNKDAVLAWQIIVATFPAVIAGFFVNFFFEDALRQLWVIATTTTVFGVLLWIADSRQERVATLTFQIAFLIGLSQCLALIPGVSRSGVTMTAALFLGLSRSASAEFSFLLSIPLILAASILKLGEVWSASMAIDWSMLALAVSLSGVSAFLCIHFFLEYINRIGFKPFVIYRLLLGLTLFALL